MPDRMTFDINSEKAFQRRRRDLVAQFGSWLPHELAEVVDPEDFGMLLEWKLYYGDGHLGCWTREELSEFLLGWCPRKLAAPLDLVGSLPLAVSTAMRFLAECRLLDPRSDPVVGLGEHAVSLTVEFLEAMADPANFGMGKSIFSSIGIDDPTALGPADLERVMAEFNALPQDVRKAVTDPALGYPGNRYDDDDDEDTAWGPIRVPPENVVRASAESSEAFDRFVKISDYFAAPGKALTPKGNLKLADARALVDILATEDVDEETIGDQVFCKRSATEFPWLDFWQRWAREAGVVRRKHSRLVSVAAWRKRLAADPVATLIQAVTVLLDCGALSSYRTNALRRAVDELLDYSAHPLLLRLAEGGELEEYDEQLALIAQIARETGVREYYPGDTADSYDTLLTVLERAGVVTQHGETRVVKAPRISSRSGGTVAITPFGVAAAVAAAQERGMTVELERDPRELTLVEMLGRLEDDDVEADFWWDCVVEWLAVQDDRGSAVGALVGALSDEQLVSTVLLAPDSLWPELTPILRAIVDQAGDAVSPRDAVAVSWLLEHDRSTAVALGQERLFESALLTLEMLAGGDDEVVLELLGEGRDIEEQTRLVMAVAVRGRPTGLGLLEAIGRTHLDKGLGKLARKEAFRLRSKLASARHH